MRRTWFTSGDWNAICDVCGFKFKASQLQRRWDGLMVCSKDWETRHPQELIRPIPDQSKLPWTRPEGSDRSVAPTNTGSAVMLAGTSSIVITNTLITPSSQILVTGTSQDSQGILNSRITVGSGTATIYASVAPTADWTIYYTIV